MSNRASEIAASMHDSAVRVVADLWDRCRHRRELEDFALLCPDEAGRIARDLQMNTAGLVRLAGRGSGALDLLKSRAKQCGIDLDELERAHGDVERDLTRCCALCRNKARCGRDLRLRPQNLIWRTYCPNSETFTAVSLNRAADG
jgi:hypothetical protein